MYSIVVAYKVWCTIRIRNHCTLVELTRWNVIAYLTFALSVKISARLCMSVSLSVYLSHYLPTYISVYSYLALTCSHFHTTTNPSHSLTRTLSLSLPPSRNRRRECVWRGVRDCGYKDMNIWHRFTCMCMWALPVYDVGVFMGVSMPSIPRRPTPCPACTFHQVCSVRRLNFSFSETAPRQFGYGRLG